MIYKKLVLYLQISKWTLTVGIILTIGYFLLAPAINGVFHPLPKEPQFPYSSSILPPEQTNKTESDFKPPEESTIVIPSIGVNSPIKYGGDSFSNKTVWHDRNSTVPGAGGNIVMVGHRFSYKTGDNSFYYLPNLKVGEIIQIFWNKKEHLYKVTESMEVEADQIEILTPSETEKLTLYTCTPLWTAHKRHVIIAIPFEKEN